MSSTTDNSIRDLIEAARALLVRIENMTTVQFSHGDEKEERNRLRAVLTRMGELNDDGVVSY